MMGHSRRRSFPVIDISLCSQDMLFLTINVVETYGGVSDENCKDVVHYRYRHHSNRYIW